MKRRFRGIIFFSFAVTGAAGAVDLPTSCKSIEVNHLMFIGSAKDAAPDKIYNFVEIRKELLASLDKSNQGQSACLSDFYRQALDEEGRYWGARLAKGGCQVSASGEITGQCPDFLEAKKSVQFVSSLDRDLRTRLHEKIEQSTNARAQASGEAIKSAQRCQKSQNPSAQDIRDIFCCGTENDSAGMIRAIEPKLNHPSCIGKTRPTREEFFSGGGVAECLGQSIAAAAKIILDSLASVLKLPGELLAARSQLWALMTQPAARQKFASLLMDQFKHFFTDRVDAFGCYNNYQKAQFVCKTGGEIIATCALPETLGAFLGLASKPVVAGAKALGEILSKTEKGAAILKGLESTNAIAAKGLEAIGKVGAKAADAIDGATGGLAKKVTNGAERAADSLNNGRRLIGRPISFAAEKAAAKIENSAPFQKLLVVGFKAEKNAAIADELLARKSVAQQTENSVRQEQPSVRGVRSERSKQERSAQRANQSTAKGEQTPIGQQSIGQQVPQAGADISPPRASVNNGQALKAVEIPSTANPASITNASRDAARAPEMESPQTVIPATPPQSLATTTEAPVLARSERAAAPDTFAPTTASPASNRTLPSVEVNLNPSPVFDRASLKPAARSAQASKTVDGVDGSPVTEIKIIAHTETGVSDKARTYETSADSADLTSVEGKVAVDEKPIPTGTESIPPETATSELAVRHEKSTNGRTNPNLAEPKAEPIPILKHPDYMKLERNVFHSAEKDLFNIPRGTRTESAAANEKVIDDMKAWPRTDAASRRSQGLNHAQIDKLYSKVRDNKVSSICSIGKYDLDGKMGFCFGRATTAHIEAIRAGIDMNQIRKVWAVGTFKNSLGNWRYHVATVVRDADGAWIAIDPVFERPIPVEDWLFRMKSMQDPEKIKNMRLFTTRPERFSPSSNKKYSPTLMGTGDHPDKYYNGFFKDLMPTFKDPLPAAPVEPTLGP